MGPDVENYGKTTSEAPTRSVGVQRLVMRCRDCCHWDQDTFFDFDGAINTGYCGPHLGLKVGFELRTGWNGGVVDKVETEEDFFCANFNVDCDVMFNFRRKL